MQTVSPKYDPRCTAPTGVRTGRQWHQLPAYYPLLRAAQGFQKLRNVTGGIDAYSREVDSSVPQY